MATYLCVKVSSGTRKYKAKSTIEAGRPYLRVHGVYFPLTTEATTGPQIKFRKGGEVYRIIETYTTSIPITTTTGTSYKTQKSTSGTSYLTQKSTYDTVYDTAASTYATSYLTCPYTYDTIYETSRRTQPIDALTANHNIFYLSINSIERSQGGIVDLKATANVNMATNYPPIVTRQNENVNIEMVRLSTPGTPQYPVNYAMRLNIGSSRKCISNTSYEGDRYIRPFGDVTYRYKQSISYTDQATFTHADVYGFNLTIPVITSTKKNFNTSFTVRGIQDTSASTGLYGMVYEGYKDNNYTIGVRWEDNYYVTETTNTRYLTQSSTYATSYLTQKSTYNTRYLTQKSTYDTSYLTQSSTYDTVYLTTTSTSQVTSQ